MRLATLALLFLAAFSASAQELILREVASGLDMPVGLAHANDDRLFIITQPGRIVVFDGRQILQEPFLDIASGVTCCTEQGLLGLAFHPRYEENGFFYVSYVDLRGDLLIARYQVGADPNVADAESGMVILTVRHRDAAFHYGGQLAFGPDGYLYISTGDGTWPHEEDTNSQSLRSLLGKILRIDVDGYPNDLIPPTNPFVGREDALPEIWAYGLRNPWRFSFDRRTGDLWIADVGADLREEINIQRATSGGGENYGWRAMEGLHCPTEECDEEEFVAPVLEYPHLDGACAVTGGYRYRGANVPVLYGAYLYADFCSGRIQGARPLPGGRWTPMTLLDSGFFISSFGEDRHGELYVIDYGGSLYEIAGAVPVLRRPVTAVRPPN